MAQALIDAGANIDAKNDYGETPLHRAIGNRRMEMAQWLIAAGATSMPKIKMAALHCTIWQAGATLKLHKR